jgi:hypothetical protein
MIIKPRGLDEIPISHGRNRRRRPLLVPLANRQQRLEEEED